MIKIRTKILEKGEIIPLNYDFIFNAIFNKEENIDLIENFISCYLNIPIIEIKGNIKIMKRRLDLNSKKLAGKEIDLLLNYKGNKINIELNNAKSKEVFLERNIVFACNIHSSQLKYRDKNYKNIQKTIQINLNCGIENKSKKIIESYYFTNEHGKKLSEKIRIDMVDVALGNKIWYPNTNDKLSRWCKALLSKTLDDLKVALGENMMEEISKNKLLEEVIKLSSDEEYLGVYTELSKSEMERNTEILNAEERGEKIGFERGSKDGFERGSKDGFERGKLEIAKKMLDENMNVELISKLTNIPVNELKKLK